MRTRWLVSAIKLELLRALKPINRRQSVTARSVKMGGPFKSLDESMESTKSVTSPAGASCFDISIESRWQETWHSEAEVTFLAATRRA